MSQNVDRALPKALVPRRGWRRTVACDVANVFPQTLALGEVSPAPTLTIVFRQSARIIGKRNPFW